MFLLTSKDVFVKIIFARRAKNAKFLMSLKPLKSITYRQLWGAFYSFQTPLLVEGGQEFAPSVPPKGVPLVATFEDSQSKNEKACNACGAV